MGLRVFLDLGVLIWASTIPRLLLLPLPVANGDDQNATQFLDDQEVLVQAIANYALQNYLNADALAATCSSTNTNCSRAVCKPLLRDLDEGHLTCEAVPINVDCQGTNNSVCTDAQGPNTLVSREEAFVRWPPDANIDEPSCDMKATICAQRELDEQIFKPSSANSNFILKAWTYFGASNGIDRIYPGKELNADLCSKYEPRERPWFVGATAVMKELVVMLDDGPTMGNQLSLYLGDETVFDAGRNIILRLLNTLTAGDAISVLTFGPGSSNGPKISINDSPAVKNEAALKPLQDFINNLPEPTTSAVSPINLTEALIRARDQFGAVSLQIKVIIIITAGYNMVGEDLQPDLLNSLKAMKVVAFIYRLLFDPKYGSKGDFIAATLSSVSCSLEGWYEESEYDSQNPLGTIQSFYSYFAKLRFENISQPFWVQEYPAYSGIGNLSTVAYPVFNGLFLVGVAGVDVIVDSLGSISSNVVQLLFHRHRADPISLNATPVPCGQRLLSEREYQCPQALKDNAGVTGICTADVDNNPNAAERFLERVCCGVCPWKSSHHDGLSTAEKFGVVFGVFGGLLFILLVCRGIAWCGG